jgi:hypothetical protein
MHREHQNVTRVDPIVPLDPETMHDLHRRARKP